MPVAGLPRPVAPLLPGKAAAVIADQVRRANIDLLVMGAYCHSQPREFFVGNTTTKLVRTCPVSVLMFRCLTRHRARARKTALARTARCRTPSAITR
jgi:nucleotide-binding universal stress UspA family protein